MTGRITCNETGLSKLYGPKASACVDSHAFGEEGGMQLSFIGCTVFILNHFSHGGGGEGVPRDPRVLLDSLAIGPHCY